MPSKGYTTRIPRNCRRCGLEFFIYPSAALDNRGTFCSRGCAHIRRTCVEVIGPSTAYVPLDDKGIMYALIDSWNVEIANLQNWSVLRISSGGLYAKSNVRWSWQQHTLHAAICHSEDGQHIDHRNGNGLDDREVNLRPCSPSQNIGNTGPHRDSISGIKGIKPSRSKWQSSIMCQGKSYYLGTFETKEAASHAYAEAAQRLFGEFARV